MGLREQARPYGGETAKVCVEATTSEHGSIPAHMVWSLGFTVPFVTEAVLACVAGSASTPAATASTPATISFAVVPLRVSLCPIRYVSSLCLDLSPPPLPLPPELSTLS